MISLKKTLTMGTAQNPSPKDAVADAKTLLRDIFFSNEEEANCSVGILTFYLEPVVTNMKLHRLHTPLADTTDSRKRSSGAIRHPRRQTTR